MIRRNKRIRTSRVVSRMTSKTQMKISRANNNNNRSRNNNLRNRIQLDCQVSRRQMHLQSLSSHLYCLKLRVSEIQSIASSQHYHHEVGQVLTIDRVTAVTPDKIFLRLFTISLRFSYLNNLKLQLWKIRIAK